MLGSDAAHVRSPAGEQGLAHPATAKQRLGSTNHQHERCSYDPARIVCGCSEFVRSSHTITREPRHEALRSIYGAGEDLNHGCNRRSVTNFIGGMKLAMFIDSSIESSAPGLRLTALSSARLCIAVLANLCNEGCKHRDNRCVHGKTETMRVVLLEITTRSITKKPRAMTLGEQIAYHQSIGEDMRNWMVENNAIAACASPKKRWDDGEADVDALLFSRWHRIISLILGMATMSSVIGLVGALKVASKNEATRCG